MVLVSDHGEHLGEHGLHYTHLFPFQETLHVPLMIRAKAVGVLCLYTHHPYPFSEDERYFMKAVADECGLAIQQSRIHTIFRQSYETLVNDFQIWFESGYRQL